MENTIEKINQLIDHQPVCLLSSVDENGYPNTRAMLAPVKREGLKFFYWHTNSSSQKIKHYRANAQAGVYFFDPQQFQGVLLKGKMEVIDDSYLKHELWEEGFSIYYQGGVEGGDFIILKFIVSSARYYSNFSNEDLPVN